jgi:predicted TPR repeat methyltransferase
MSETNKQRAYFNRATPTFDRIYDVEGQSRFERFINRRLHADIPGRFDATLAGAGLLGAESVCDIGCGSGRLLLALAEQNVTRLVGVDLSETMLEAARARLGELPGASCELIHSGFADWQTEERFDLVTALGFFDYQPDPGRLLQKMHRLARRAAIASFPRRHWLRMPLRRLRYLVRSSPVFFYNRAGIEALSRQAGFSEVEIRALPGSHASYIATFTI